MQEQTGAGKDQQSDQKGLKERILDRVDDATADFNDLLGTPGVEFARANDQTKFDMTAKADLTAETGAYSLNPDFLDYIDQVRSRLSLPRVDRAAQKQIIYLFDDYLSDLKTGANGEEKNEIARYLTQEVRKMTALNEARNPQLTDAQAAYNRGIQRSLEWWRRKFEQGALL